MESARSFINQSTISPLDKFYVQPKMLIRLHFVVIYYCLLFPPFVSVITPLLLFFLNISLVLISKNLFSFTHLNTLRKVSSSNAYRDNHLQTVFTPQCPSLFELFLSSNYLLFSHSSKNLFLQQRSANSLHTTSNQSTRNLFLFFLIIISFSLSLSLFLSCLIFTVRKISSSHAPS